MTVPIYILEDHRVDDLFPLTYCRPASLLRCGSDLLIDRMLRNLPRPPDGLLIRDTLAVKYRDKLGIPINPPVIPGRGAIFINARWLMTEPFQEPPPDCAGVAADDFAWMHISGSRLKTIDLKRIVRSKMLDDLSREMSNGVVDATMIRFPWDLLRHTRTLLSADFKRRGNAKKSKPMKGVYVLAEDNIYVGTDVQIFPGVIIDATNGPVWIENHAIIRPNAVITGPVYVGEHCVIRTGADIREETILGPHTRVGGEVSASLFQGYGNKQHEGFVGNSVIGEWVNMGAGTITSNLKNTLGEVRVPINGRPRPTGLTFLGAIIGDHAKLGIGTMLGTGSVTGFASHVLTTRPPKFVPSFSWVTDEAVSRLDFNKMVVIARLAMARRNVELTLADQDIFNRILSSYSTVEEHSWLPQ
jgi:UDP-N-acetylglucosamine diphosphorylase/glucosamine-1-phosphate N-acetyltransferase